MSKAIKIRAGSQPVFFVAITIDFKRTVNNPRTDRREPTASDERARFGTGGQRR